MNVKIMIGFVLGVLLVSCKDKPVHQLNEVSDLIEISKAQFNSEKMAVGLAEYLPFADKVHFTAVVLPSTGGQAQISLPLPGRIEKIYCTPAQIVDKGELLFEISGYWFIDLQSDYSESSAILSKLECDYLRAKELYSEKIITQKDYSAAKSSYYAENAKLQALKHKLESLGLDVAKIKEGVFYPSFSVKSPISGSISSIGVAIGQYVEPQQSIADIIDHHSLQLKLSIFENDIHQIEHGQKVAFYLNANRAQAYHARICAIGKTIMPDSKSITCYAEIENPNSINMVSNQCVIGDVFTAVDTLLAVPNTAVISADDNSYVLLYENADDSMYYFKKVRINTGRETNDYVELLAPLPSDTLLQDGTYNIVID